MDQDRFAAFTVALARDGTGRRLTRRVVGVGVVSLLAALGLSTTEPVPAAAKKGGRRRRRCKPQPSGARCETDRDCCTKKTLRLCDVPQNAGNSDTVCCGGDGAPCGGVDDNGDAQPPLCCVGQAGVRAFVCSQNDETNPGVPGTCLPAPTDL
jgi:hypothetical protein